MGMLSRGTVKRCNYCRINYPNSYIIPEECMVCGNDLHKYRNELYDPDWVEIAANLILIQEGFNPEELLH